MDNLSGTPPVAICQDITINLDNNGLASISASDIDDGSYGMCDITSIAISQTDFDCTHVGTNPVLLTVMDSNNNSSTCTANVYIDPSNCVTCDDGIQNGDEEGIDCGGSYCTPCAVCTVSMVVSFYIIRPDNFILANMTC